MTESPDFQPEQTPSQPKSAAPTVLLIIGGVGCGCLGLIFIMGIIGAIALPSFLGQANKAKQSEAKQNVGAMIRGQQAHFLEQNRFAATVDEMKMGIPPETENYRYEVQLQPDGRSTKITATAKDLSLKSYTGAVFAVPQGIEATTIKGLCESDKPTNQPPAMPTLNTSITPPTVDCPSGSSPL